MRPRLLAVDGLNLIRRIYEARQVEQAADMPAAIEATAASLGRALQRHQPTHAVVVLEFSDKTWRHLLYPDYKAGRSATPALLVESLPDYRRAFQARGVASIEIESYEADDVIATLASTVSIAGGDVVILSTDKIYLQLVNRQIQLFDHFNERAFHPADVEEKYGVTPQRFVDYLSLVGDSSNNIKGVPGVGPKSAISLLDHFDTLDRMLDDSLQAAVENDPQDPSGKARRIAGSLRKVHSSASQARRCQQLVTLKTDVALGLNLRDLRLGDSQVDA